MRYRTAPAVPAHSLRQRAFRAEHAAPETADKHHAQEHERPPDTPENELGEKREIGPDMGCALGRRQKCRNDNQKRVGGGDTPLHGQDRSLMPHEPIARCGQKAIGAVCRGPFQAAFAIRSLMGADEKINHGTLFQSSARAAYLTTLYGKKGAVSARRLQGNKHRASDHGHRKGCQAWLISRSAAPVGRQAENRRKTCIRRHRACE